MSLSSEIQNLDQIADTMNRLSQSSPSSPRYDIMSDALYWDDELPPKSQRKPTRTYQSMRFVFRYRTTLILGRPDHRLEEMWKHALSQFPNWIGFDSTRCNEDSRLAETFERLKQESEASSGLPDYEE